MIGNLGGWHLLLFLAVLLLLFGATKLPALARSLGQSARAYKAEMRGLKEDQRSEAAQASPAEPT